MQECHQSARIIIFHMPLDIVLRGMIDIPGLMKISACTGHGMKANSS